MPHPGGAEKSQPSNQDTTSFWVRGHESRKFMLLLPNRQTEENGRLNVHRKSPFVRGFWRILCIAESQKEVQEDMNKLLKDSNNDHWAFLEEIEAPMWVDLRLEANSNHQDIDGEWFYRSHPFHQCSSLQLKAAFSHSGEEGTAFDLLGPSSPMLPSSVSKSRGKNYVSNKWRGDNQDLPLDKHHPVNALSGTSSCVNSGSSDKMKSKSSFIHFKGTSGSKSSWVCKSSLTGNGIPNCSKPISSSGDSTCSLSIMTNKADESNTTSTITSERGQQQQQNMEKSSWALNQTNGILAVLKTGMSKSCVTRKASRVEINGDRRQSRGRKSSSSKSSVGSSSNPCSDVKSSTSTSIQYKERTPDSRNVARSTYAAKDKIIFSKVSKTSTHKIERGTSNYRMGPNVAMSTHQDAAKPRVQVQTLKRKPLEPVRVNEKKSITATVKYKEKPVVGGYYRLAESGKENVKGIPAGSQKCNGKDVAAVMMVRGQKATKESILQGNGKRGLAGKGKVSSQNHWVNLKDVSERPPFR